MSSIQPKKRKVVDLETKYNALKEVSLGKKSKQAIAQEAGVPPCTLSHWIKDRLKIEDAFTTSKFGPKRKRMKTSRWEDLDEAVDIWLREKRSKNVHISGTLLQETARDLAAKMGIEDFKGGNGWLSGFKERKGLSLRTIQGEAKSDSRSTWIQWNLGSRPFLLTFFARMDPIASTMQMKLVFITRLSQVSR